MRLTDLVSYADAQAHASSAALWDLFDGDRERLNIAHECILRHADGTGRVAVRIAHADGRVAPARVTRLPCGHPPAVPC